MTKDNEKYQAYVQILNEELIPAMGCTEPIALAYAAAKAREVLGCLPDRVCIGASGSIIKNVKSVIVPNTNHLKGIPAAAAAGIVAGNAEKELEVISGGNLILPEWGMVVAWSLLGVVFYAICKSKYKEDFGSLVELISDEDSATLMPEADEEELDEVIDHAIDVVLGV